MPKHSKSEQATSLARLRELCPPGTTIHCILRRTSRSGLSRVIDFYVLQPHEGSIAKYWVSSHVAVVLGLSCSDDGVRVQGGGMDMGFATVHALSYALHGRENVNVPEAKRGCPFKASPTAYRAGYSLNHEWL